MVCLYVFLEWQRNSKIKLESTPCGQELPLQVFTFKKAAAVKNLLGGD
jgi:hypothetical protein